MPQILLYLTWKIYISSVVAFYHSSCWQVQWGSAHMQAAFWTTPDFSPSLTSMPTMESESSITSRAEEFKSLANEAFKGNACCEDLLLVCSCLYHGDYFL